MNAHGPTFCCKICNLGPGPCTASGTRRLTLVLDKTYILQGVDIVSLRRGRGYVGTGFKFGALTRPSEHEEQATGFLKLKPKEEMDQNEEDDSWDAADLDYAHEMLEMLLYNPECKGLPRYPVCSVPTVYKMTGLEMAQVVGRVLKSGGQNVRCIVFDNATQHALMKHLLLGTDHGLTLDALEALPFWSEINYQSFPDSTLPRWPFKKPMIGNETLYLALNGFLCPVDSSQKPCC